MVVAPHDHQHSLNFYMKLTPVADVGGSGSDESVFVGVLLLRAGFALDSGRLCYDGYDVMESGQIDHVLSS